MREYNANTVLTDQESSAVWQMKAWAVLFVICAHCGYVTEQSSYCSHIVSRLLGTLGSLGVPVFFFLSGYVFKYKPFSVWLRKKFKDFVIPWLFCGTMVYLYVVMRKGGLSFFSWLRWIFGENSYLWYMTVMILLWLCAEIIYKAVAVKKWDIKVICAVGIIASVCGLILEYTHIIDFHPYLNIFRWLWIFLLGIILRQNHLIKSTKKSAWILPAFIAVLLSLSVIGIDTNYWKYNFFIIAPITIFVFIHSFVRNHKIGRLIEDIGKKSFAIYLIHMPVAGVVVNVFSRFSDFIGILTFIRPIIVLCITYLFILILERISDLIGLNKAWLILVGIRK